SNDVDFSQYNHEQKTMLDITYNNESSLLHYLLDNLYDEKNNLHKQHAALIIAIAPHLHIRHLIFADKQKKTAFQKMRDINSELKTNLFKHMHNAHCSKPLASHFQVDINYLIWHLHLPMLHNEFKNPLSPRKFFLQFTDGMITQLEFLHSLEE